MLSDPPMPWEAYRPLITDHWPLFPQFPPLLPPWLQYNAQHLDARVPWPRGSCDEVAEDLAAAPQWSLPARLLPASILPPRPRLRASPVPRHSPADDRLRRAGREQTRPASLPQRSRPRYLRRTGKPPNQH